MSTKTARPPKEEQRAFFLDIYRAFVGIKTLGAKQKYAAFETLLENSRRIDFWIVDAITEDALSAIASSWSSEGVRRAHRLDRWERGNWLFESGKVRRGAFEFFLENDRVTIATVKENATGGTAHWSKQHDLPEDLFGWHTGWGISLTKRRVAALKDLREKVGSGG